MYTFANFLAFVRTLCRKGALYFIRDPTDPTYSPVKDIIERPGGSQARKVSPAH
jgi:E3 ubiquitin-protein ligase MARCH6